MFSHKDVKFNAQEKGDIFIKAWILNHATGLSMEIKWKR